MAEDFAVIAKQNVLFARFQELSSVFHRITSTAAAMARWIIGETVRPPSLAQEVGARKMLAYRL